jgi:dynein heavy chain
MQTSITTFMDQRFERIITTQGALLLMQKFESLGIPNLGIVEKYQRIVAHYSRELDNVLRIYQKNKTDPPISRDLPPISG